MLNKYTYTCIEYRGTTIIVKTYIRASFLNIKTKGAVLEFSREIKSTLHSDVQANNFTVRAVSNEDGRCSGTSSLLYSPFSQALRFTLSLIVARNLNLDPFDLCVYEYVRVIASKL